MTEQKQIIVDGVDLAKLNPEELAKLSKEEWNEFKATFEAAAKARVQQEFAEIKDKLVKIRDYVLPVVRYAIWTAIALRVFGVI